MQIDWNLLTFGQALANSAARYPQRLAIIDGSERVTFAELDHRVHSLAHGLLSQGVQRGDSVAVWMANSASWVKCWLACSRIGAVMVPINTRYKAEEVEYILRQSDARMLILMDRYWDINFLDITRSIAPEIAKARRGRVTCATLPQLHSVVVWKDIQVPGLINLEDLSQVGKALIAGGATLAKENPADPIIIVYTSGTTGHPKGAVHNHIVLRNVANVARVMHVEPGDVVLGHMPFYHVAGAFTELGLSILIGCTLVPLPHWVADEALDVIERERVNIFGGIPTHFVDCIDAIRRRPRDTSSLKSAWIGGAPVTPDVALAAKTELKLKALQAVYGMTETTASTTFSEFDAPLDVLCDNKGKPIGEFEVCVCDPESGRQLPASEVGEVWVRGHIVMMGYYKNEQATAEVVTPNGWFRTGDLGVFDGDGYLKITGRLKDMFIVGGSNAYPAEIERMLQSHPQVKQAVVVGMPDHRMGEVAMAFVQLHEGAKIDAAELMAFCRVRMADYKVPRKVAFVQDFPRTSTGKIQRFILSRLAQDVVAGQRVVV
jgi:fatty-acyl-CoA synthase